MGPSGRCPCSIARVVGLPRLARIRGRALQKSGSPVPLSQVRPIDRRRQGALRGRASSGFAGGPPGQGWPAWGHRGLWLVP